MARQTHEARSKRRRNVLTIISAAVLLLTYIAKEVVKEKTKDQADSLRSAEALYRSELGLSSLETHDLVFRVINQINEINQINKTQSVKDRDYSDVIKNDVVIAQQILGDVNSSFDSVSRFIDKLPSGADDLRQGRETLRPSVDKINKEASDALKTSPAHDWTRAVQVKLLIVVLATEEMVVTELGDGVLTRSQQVQEACDKLYRFSGWAATFLFVAGVVLAVYANLSGIKGLGGE